MVEANRLMVEMGSVRYYSQMFGFTKNHNLSQKAQAVRVNEHFTIQLIVTLVIFVYAIIGFSTTLSIHQHIGLWNWYFTVEAVYSGLLYFCLSLPYLFISVPHELSCIHAQVQVDLAAHAQSIDASCATSGCVLQYVELLKTLL